MPRSPRAPTAMNRAVIPAAGFGTRLRPLTQAIPKEMLPLGRKPVLEYVVEELLEAGMNHLLFVVSPGKEIIARYFGNGEQWSANFSYVLQQEMRGLGDAVLHAEEWVNNEPFMVAFGDCIVESNLPEIPASRVAAIHAETNSDATVLTERVALEQTSRYGILTPAGPVNAGMPFEMRDIVEKPSSETAPSQWAVAARWALNPIIFKYIQQAKPGVNGEINLTDPVRDLLADGHRGWGVPLQANEARRDIGGWNTYLLASVRAAIADTEHGEWIKEQLNCHSRKHA